MEALILIFGELVFAILAPFVTLVVDVIAAIFGFLLQLFSLRGSDESAQPRRDRTNRAARTVTLVLGCIAAVIVAALWVVNSFYFDTTVRYVFATAEQRTGVVTACNSIDGSLFAGRIQLADCSIRRSSHPNTTFELGVDRVALDLRMSSLFGTAHIDTAEVEGLSGWIKGGPRQASTTDASRAEKPRRAFEIGRLDIARSNIDLSGVNRDGMPFELAVDIEHLSSQPLRSRLAFFDILFRSNAAGSIAGAPFEISMSEIEDGRQTAWRASNVPVASFGALAGGSLAWFRDGTVDIVIDDRWQRGDSLDIDMDWRLAFSDIRVEAPPGTGTVTRIVTEPLVRYVNSRNGSLPLEFQLVINENQFEHRWSLAAAGLWSAVGDAVNRLLTELGVDVDKASETGNAIKDGARSVLDRLRKPKDDNPE